MNKIILSGLSEVILDLIVEDYLLLLGLAKGERSFLFVDHYDLKSAYITRLLPLNSKIPETSNFDFQNYCVVLIVFRFALTFININFGNHA